MHTGVPEHVITESEIILDMLGKGHGARAETISCSLRMEFHGTWVSILRQHSQVADNEMSTLKTWVSVLWVF